MAAGGVLTISTAECGGTVLLSVSDNGHGIAQDVAGKMWAPFFTTRDGAVGLGLAVGECIAERQKARITYTTSERGSIFTVAFSEEGSKC